MPETWQFFVEPFHPTRGAARFKWRWRCYANARNRFCQRAATFVRFLRRWLFIKAANALAISAILRDLRDPSFATTFAIFHQRYSTNTAAFRIWRSRSACGAPRRDHTIVSNRRGCARKSEKSRAKTYGWPWLRTLEENVAIRELRHALN